MKQKAINSHSYAIAKSMIGRAQIHDAYVHGKFLVLQLSTCRFRILN